MSQSTGNGKMRQRRNTQKIWALSGGSPGAPEDTAALVRKFQELAEENAQLRSALEARGPESEVASGSAESAEREFERGEVSIAASDEFVDGELKRRVRRRTALVIGLLVVAGIVAVGIGRMLRVGGVGSVQKYPRLVQPVKSSLSLPERQPEPPAAAKTVGDGTGLQPKAKPEPPRAARRGGQEYKARQVIDRGRVLLATLPKSKSIGTALFQITQFLSKLRQVDVSSTELRRQIEALKLKAEELKRQYEGRLDEVEEQMRQEQQRRRDILIDSHQGSKEAQDALRRREEGGAR